MITEATIKSIAPLRSGRGDRNPDDLICWLHALHACHVDAGDRYDMDGYRFFFLWYCSISDTEGEV